MTKKKSRRTKRDEQQRRQRAADGRMQQLLRMEATKRQLEENTLPPAKRHATSARLSLSREDMPSPSASMYSSDNELDGWETERAEPSRARCDDTSSSSSGEEEDHRVDDDSDDGDDDVEVSSMRDRDREAAILRSASSMQVVDESCGGSGSGGARNHSMMSSLDEMVEEEIREAENRRRRQVSLGQKPAVPPKKIRIADTGIVRIPDCQRTGKLVKSLAAYPGLQLSKAWNDVRNYAMYVVVICESFLSP